MAGFTASKLADQQQGFTIPIRELIQNSLDASREAERDCNVNIYLESINKNQIPCIDEYEQILNEAIKTQKSIGSYQNQQIQVVEKIKEALNRETIQVLNFSDNGSGLSLDKLEALLSERSHKDVNNSSGGSYGVGHLSAYSLSSLRYILYTSCYNDLEGNVHKLFTGSPILAGYSDQEKSQRGPVGRIVTNPPNNELNPVYDYPTQPPSFLNEKALDISPTGTIVTILGLLEDWSEEAEYSITSNFFHALLYGSLSVNVHRQNEEPILISDVMDQRLSDRKSQKNARIARGFILSGQAVWQSYLAVKEKDFLKKIRLENGDVVHVYVKSTPDIVESSVALIRSNMLVARHDSMISTEFDSLRKNWEYSPFALVIDVDAEFAPNLFELVKKAEGPYHNQLVPNKLTNDDLKRLKRLLTELSQLTERHLKKIDRKTFSLPLFAIPNKDEENSSYGSQNSSNSKRAKPIIRNWQSPRRKQHEKKNGGGKMPTISGRRLNSRISARYFENEEFLIAKLRVIPKESNPRDITWLSFCLGEDVDKNSGTSFWLKIDSVTVNDQQKKFDKDDERIAILGELSKGVTYNVIAHLRKPEVHIGNLKYALQPILGVRRR